MREIRIGIVGLGGMANEHVKQIRQIESMRIVAVCDTDPVKVRQWAERFGVAEDKRFVHHQALVDHPEVDAVVAATPNDSHYAIIETCLRAGKPLMAEKPFTRTFAEAKQLLHLAKATKQDCFVGFSYRYVPSFRLAREWVKSGKIGKIRHVFIQYLQEWGVPLFETPMNWRWERSVTGTGVLHDLASHMVDAARYLISEPIRVSGLMSNLISERPDASGSGLVPVDIDDFAAFTALLAGDIPAVFQTSRNAYGCGNQIEASIYGETGSIHIGYEFGEKLVWVHHDEVTKTRTREEVTVPDSYKLMQMQDFANFIQGSPTEQTPTLEDGYRNQLALEAVLLSDREQRSITLSDVESAEEDTPQ